MPPTVESEWLGRFYGETDADLLALAPYKNGQLYLDITDPHTQTTYVYKDGMWAPFMQGGSNVIWKGEYDSEADPNLVPPQPNWAYYNKTNGKTYIYDGTAWQVLVSVNADKLMWKGSFTSVTDPLLAALGQPVVNWAYFNLSNSVAYVYDGSAWRMLAGVMRHTITFHADYNATYATAAQTPSPFYTQVVEYGATAVRPADPVRPGYVFAEWYTPRTAAVSEAPYIFTGPVTDDLDLYAAWIEETAARTITFHADHNATYATLVQTPSPLYIRSVEYGTRAVRPADPVRPGYAFVNWYTPKTSLDSEAVYDFTDPVTDDLDLYAAWTAASAAYTVTFHADYGATHKTDAVSPSPMYAQTVATGTRAVPPAAPVRPGYVFLNWYKPKAGATQATAYNFTTNVTGDLNLYAAWQSEIDVEDFGLNAVIEKTYDLTASNWETIRTDISTTAGNTSVKNFVINVTANANMPGFTANTFSSKRVAISIRKAANLTGSNCTIKLTGVGCMLNLGNYQTVTLRDVILKGYPSNSYPAVYLGGTSTLNMRGSSSVRENNVGITDTQGGICLNHVNAKLNMYDTSSVSANVTEAETYNYIGGVFNKGTMTMYDSSSVDHNRGSDVGGIYNMGTLIMYDNASVYNNYTRFEHGPGGIRILSGSTLAMRDNASIHHNNGIGLWVTDTSCKAKLMDNCSIYANLGQGIKWFGDRCIQMSGGVIHGNGTGANAEFFTPASLKNKNGSLARANSTPEENVHYGTFANNSHEGTFTEAGILCSSATGTIFVGSTYKVVNNMLFRDNILVP